MSEKNTNMKVNEEVKVEKVKVEGEQKEEQTKKKHYKIDFPEHEKFVEDICVTFLSSRMITERIDMIFNEIFSDYFSSKIMINVDQKSPITRYVPIGAPYVVLTFKPSDKTNKENAVTTRSDQVDETMDIGDRLALLSGSYKNGNAFVVKDRTYEILSDFIDCKSLDREGNKNIKWNDIVYETQEVMNVYDINRREAIVCISGISLQLIIEAIYGKQDDDNKYDYNIQIAKTLPAMYNGKGIPENEYLFTVSRLNQQCIYKLKKELGLTNAAGRAMINRYW